jgi:hypothetical protein
MTNTALNRGWAVCGYRVKGDRSTKVVPALYTTWQNFRRRCRTDSPVYYRWYKAKGITFCHEWNSYATFRAWALANGYRKGLQIDRADGSKGYDPSNSRWVTREVQMQNRTFSPWRGPRPRSTTRVTTMKKSEIEVGGTYTDGRGSTRLVIGDGPEYVLYSTQACTDNLRYRLLSKKRGPLLVGGEYNSTRSSFAAWAKERVC